MARIVEAEFGARYKDGVSRFLFFAAAILFCTSVTASAADIGTTAPTSPPALSISFAPSVPAPHFRTAVTSDVRPTIVTPIDIDGDDLIDFVSANYYGNTVSIFRNRGFQKFELSQHVFVGGSPTQAIPIDLNGDSAIDIAATVSATADPHVVTLTNDGHGGFAVSQRIAMPIAPVAIAAGDVDRNGSVDLVSANYYDGNITILTNNGAGHLEISQTINTGPVPHGVILDDVDHDGWIDIVICCFNSGLVQVFLNDRTGHFALKQTVAIPNGGIPHWIAAADFNEDGFTDVATSNQRSETVTVLTNDHSGNFAVMASFPATVSTYGIAAGDWDGDGHVDLAVSSREQSEPAVVLFRNLGGGRFDAPSWTVGQNVSYAPTLTRLDASATIYLLYAELLTNQLNVYSFDRVGSHVSWPANAGTWQLEEMEDWTGGWVPSAFPTIGNPVDGSNVVIVDSTNSQRFFRLSQ